MSDMSNLETSSQNTAQSTQSKPQRPKKPEIYFLRTYPFRDDSSHHHPQEENYWDETVEAETFQGEKLNITTYLLRVYPTTFNEYDAYMDIPMSYNSDIKNIKKIRSLRLDKTWEVVAGAIESIPMGYFRGDYGNNNPPAWIFGLRLNRE
ncbi:MAG: hypothetical protein ACKO4S_06215 [Snowella sp.]